MTSIDERYKRGKIYTIRCKYDDNLIYVGSTIQQLSVRMGEHRCNREKSKQSNPDTTLTKAVCGDWDNWYIELYENYPCNSKQELEKREGQVIRELGTINRCVAGRTKKQHYQENRDKILEKKKQKITCECGCEVSKAVIYQHKKTKKHQDLMTKI